MDIRLAQRDARAVRASIARAILGDGCTPGVIGGIALRSHQLVAIDRLRVILRERHGALLADEVGLGKTYVAAALLREASHPLVIAPASLRSMWREALVAADVAAEFVSYESLSRGRSPRTVAPDLIVLDEATEGLAPLIVAEIWRIVGVIRASGIASLIVDRNYRAVLAHTVRCVVLQKGLVVLEGPSASLRDDARLATYLGV